MTLQRSTIASYKGFPRCWSLSPKCSRRSLAFSTVLMRRRHVGLAANQANHIDIGEHDHSVLHHRLDLIDRTGNFLTGVDNGNHDRQIARERKAPALVSMALHSVSENAAI